MRFTRNFALEPMDADLDRRAGSPDYGTLDKLSARVLSF
jgi:hypothetical protein